MTGQPPRTKLACGICRRDPNREPFRVPHDKNGMARMDEHMRKVHPR